ncbi:FxsA family protein [Paractinoplanes rishiriensis]|uniref:Uncharacterized protein n=1 Tax=Paractinoplanes rishiriensis TaxID=1050105 RepID=A0A919MZS2_9ACTN|nr:FxsA family protein [Actinoplanes rishiriensis]GIE98690.1 hypothetical protein Ari01nite_61550 [Actinoplanes rishiriensis]
MRRRGLALLPLAVSVLAFAEIVVFLSVLHALGGAWTLALLAVSSLAGMVLLRREGVRGWRAFRAAAEEGRPPGGQVTSSLVGLGGALLLAMPGFITGVLGLLLLLPPGRQLARHRLERYTEKQMGAAVAGDLFGPRFVRARRGEPVVVVQPEEPVRPPAAQIEGEVIEGEVLR